MTATYKIIKNGKKITESGEILRTVFNNRLNVEFTLIDNGDRVRWIQTSQIIK